MPQENLPLAQPLQTLSEITGTTVDAQTLATAFAGAVGVIIAFYTIMLFYHWLRYGGSAVPVLVTMVCYVGAMSLLLSTMVNALGSIPG